MIEIEILKESDEFDYLNDDDEASEEICEVKKVRNQNVLKEVYDSYSHGNLSNLEEYSANLPKDSKTSIVGVDFIFDEIHFKEDLKAGHVIESEESNLNEEINNNENKELDDYVVLSDLKSEGFKTKSVDPLEYPFSCGICFSIQTNSVDLYDHVESHKHSSRDSSYICNHCGKNFSGIFFADLCRHVRSHEKLTKKKKKLK